MKWIHCSDSMVDSCRFADRIWDQRDEPIYLRMLSQMPDRLDGTGCRVSQTKLTWVILYFAPNRITETLCFCFFFFRFPVVLTQTLFTSAVWPKNVCFGDCSRTSQSLHVLSTDPVTYVFLSGDNEIETTSPQCASNSDVFLPTSKSHMQIFMSPEPVIRCVSSRKRHELKKPS